MTTSSVSERTTLTSAEVTSSLSLFKIKAGKFVSEQVLKELLPDVETALFFAQAYGLGYGKVSDLLRLLFRGIDVIDALLGESYVHSTMLQDYIVDMVPDDIQAQHGGGKYDDDVPVPDTELLGQLFEAAVTEVAESIQAVADKIGSVLERLPSKYGHMTFKHMHRLNVQRNSIGTYDPQIVHEHVPPRLVVLDVSGSMTEGTIRRIVDEVVGLAYSVNASMAIVSNSAFLWEAGTFDVDTVLAAAEYGGTHYEQLTPIFHRDWDTVITIADYDSSAAAYNYLARRAKGRVKTVFDVSLVNRPTFLAECVGQIASEVRPLLIGDSWCVLQA